MQGHDFGGYRVETDEILTKNWYAQYAGWDCDCGRCRNFLTLARRGGLPAPITNILQKLGIPPEKATYVCEISPETDGFCYQFSYRIAGNIRTVPALTDKKRDWGTLTCWHEPYPHGAPGFPEPHFDLEFCTVLPWVLEDSPDGVKR